MLKTPFQRMETDEESSSTLFRDTLFLLIGTLGAVLLLLYILPTNPKVSDDDNARSRGNVRIEVIWPNDYDVDVDTWVQAPGLPPVGYSNMNGPIFNLVRDDLGGYADITGINYETAFSRGIPPGEWTVNVHWYSNSANKISVPVKVFVTMRKDDSENSKDRPQQIIQTTVTLRHVGHEITVVRFRTDSDGNLIQDSVNSIPKKLRSASSQRGQEE